MTLYSCISGLYMASHLHVKWTHPYRILVNCKLFIDAMQLHVEVLIILVYMPQNLLSYYSNTVYKTTGNPKCFITYVVGT